MYNLSKLFVNRLRIVLEFRIYHNLSLFERFCLNPIERMWYFH